MTNSTNRTNRTNRTKQDVVPASLDELSNSIRGMISSLDVLMRTDGRLARWEIAYNILHILDQEKQLVNTLDYFFALVDEGEMSVAHALRATESARVALAEVENLIDKINRRDW